MPEWEVGLGSGLERTGLEFVGDREGTVAPTTQLIIGWYQWWETRAMPRLGDMKNKGKGGRERSKEGGESRVGGKHARRRCIWVWGPTECGTIPLLYPKP